MEAEIRQLDDAVRAMLSDDLPTQLATVRQALDENDLQRAALEVHTVHGSAAFCRLEPLRRAAATLEQSLKQNKKNAEHIRAFEDHAKAVLRLLDDQ